MPIQRLHTNSRMSKIVVHNGTVYLAGQVADDTSGSVEQQTQQILKNVERLLAEAGSSVEHMLSVTIYLRDIDAHFAAMNAVWDQWLPEGVAPARAAVEGRLYKPEVLVELMVTAALAD